MLAKRIIPCLDVTGGRVVKGVKFLDLVDAGDPVAVAWEYDRQGADELVFLDITASSDNRNTMVHVVGVGMRSHVGIASQMFRTLAEEGINIQMISTSEIKIAVVVDEKYLELAVRVLHKAFELEGM